MSRYYLAFVATIVVFSTIVVHATSATLIATASVTSHTCSSTGSSTIKGSLSISNVDLTLLTAQKASIASCFTSQLRLSSSLNVRATAQVDGLSRLPNGDCQVSYSCSGVGHSASALTGLKAVPNTNAFKTTLGKCSRSSGTQVGTAVQTGSGVGIGIGLQPLVRLLNLGSSLTGGLIAAVTSHTCSSTGSPTIKGSLSISNVDLTLLTAQKASLASCFTSQLQLSSSLNVRATAQVDGLSQLPNGDCQVSYTCSGVGHSASALTGLKAAPNTNAFKTTLGKCSRSSGTQVGTAVQTGSGGGIGIGLASPVGLKQTSGGLLNLGSSLTGGLIAAVTSHTCSSTGSSTIKGSLSISNVDLTLLIAQKASLASCFTSQLQLSSSLNVRATAQVDGLSQLPNGDCQVSYTCSGVGHSASALTGLKAAPNTNAFKTTLGKCSRSSGTQVGTAVQTGSGGGIGIGLASPVGLKQTSGGLLNLGSSLTGGLIAAVTSHTCSSTGSSTIKGSLSISNVDLTLLIAQKASLASCFTSQLQLSSSLNVRATAQVDGLSQLPNGDCQVSYSCSGVGHSASALTGLKAVPNTDAFKTTLGKCSRSSGAKADAGSQFDSNVVSGVQVDRTTDTVGQVTSSVDSNTQVDSSVYSNLHGDESIDSRAPADNSADSDTQVSDNTDVDAQLTSNADSDTQVSESTDSDTQVGDGVDSTTEGVGSTPSNLQVEASTDTDANGDNTADFDAQVGGSVGSSVGVSDGTSVGAQNHISGGIGIGLPSPVGLKQASGGLLNLGSSLTGGLIAAVTSHTCSSTGSSTIKGSLSISNVDLTLLTAQKASLASCFTSQLQLSSSLNVRATAQVDGLSQLPNGDCQVSYSCSGVGHSASALTGLKAVPNTNAFKTTIGKCLHSTGGH